MTERELEKLLASCYSKDLCYPKVREKWSNDNKCWGMCAITSLIVDDYFDTEFGKIMVDGGSHYFNIKDGKIIDLTANQFEEELDYSNYETTDRAKILSNEDTKMRYIKLRDRIKRSFRVKHIPRPVKAITKSEEILEMF